MHPKEKDGQAECVFCELASWTEKKAHVPSIHDSILTLAMSEKTHPNTLRILTVYLACVVNATSDLTEGEVKYGHVKSILDMAKRIGVNQAFTFKGGNGRAGRHPDEAITP